jgi:hypothetical protein
MMNRDQLDKVAWLSIRSRAPIPISKAGSARPLDYASLDAQLRDGVSFEYAWSNFLHAFYAYRTASFFAHPSPSYLSPRYQSLLAGVAEYLSAEFELPYPASVASPQYFLDTPWDTEEDLGLDMSEFLADRMARSPEAFRKRNIAYLSRNLITL